MRPDLGGEDFYAYALQSEVSAEASPGRPSQIHPEILRRNVIELQLVLEQNWGEVGWLLSQAKTESDVRTAFNRIVNPRCNLLEAFTKDQIRHTTPAILSKLRKEVKESAELRRRNFEYHRSAHDRCESAFNAWANESDTLKRAQIQEMRSKLLRNFEEAESLGLTSRLKCEALERELKESEAHFAQSEILRFIQSNRRRFTPLNVARAMAGLPLVTARVSSELCTRYGINPADGMFFQMFRAIERVLKEPIQDLGRSIDSMRTDLLMGPEKDLLHAADLRKNWYFLDSAIRSAARGTRAPRGSFAFRTFAEYCKFSASHAAAEALLADAHRLFVNGEDRQADSRPKWSAAKKSRVTAQKK